MDLDIFQETNLTKCIYTRESSGYFWETYGNDRQTDGYRKKRTFTDAVKKGRIPQDLLSKGPVEQLNEVYGKELNRLGRAS